VSAQGVPLEPIPAEFPPLIIEAESGTGGADFTTVTQGDLTVVTINPSAPNPAAPGSDGRVLSYQVELPAAGEYELYARVRVGPGGASDDSLFYASGFGAKDPLNGNDWITVNNLSTVGYSLPEQIVAGGIGVPLGTGFRWINLAEYNGGDAPVRFTVAAGALVQTLQIGAREDGLEIDKLALVASAVSQTVAELDAGLAGNIIPPPPPPRTCVPLGPPLAANQSKFLGGVHSPSQLPNFAAYFNQVIPENAGKWGSVEGTRDVMSWAGLDAAYAFAKANGFPIKMHVMIWGNQQPAWIETLPPAEQLEEIIEWFAEVSARYPELDTIDVVNEPLHDPPTSPGSGGGNYAEALGGAGVTGWDWIITAFRLGRQYFPNSELMLNDYSIINSPADTIRYKEIIALLQAEDLIDAVGEQGHAFSTRGANDVMQASLDSLAEMGLPLFITELDIDGPTDAIQLADYQRLFPLFWEHPAVQGITLWGYRPGHWRSSQGAFIALETGAEKPALRWLREYLDSPAITPVAKGQAFSVSELAAAGDSVGIVEATDGEANTWLILGGTGAELFELDPDTGLISVAEGVTLDAALTPEVTLEVVARDECSFTPLTLTILPNTAPVVAPGQVLTLDADLESAGRVLGSDAEGSSLTYSVVGGSGASLFSVDALTGEVLVAQPPPSDVSHYTLLVSASDGELTSEPVSVQVNLPRRVRICLAHRTQLVPRAWVPLGLRLGAELGACTTPRESWLAPFRRLLERIFERLG
jgi:endo-1,4-beta-xylanase